MVFPSWLLRGRLPAFAFPYKLETPSVNVCPIAVRDWVERVAAPERKEERSTCYPCRIFLLGNMGFCILFRLHRFLQSEVCGFL